jgi:hypothetical protein
LHQGHPQRFVDPRGIVQAEAEHDGSGRRGRQSDSALTPPPRCHQFRGLAPDAEIIACDDVTARARTLREPPGPADAPLIANALRDAVADKGDTNGRHGVAPSLDRLWLVLVPEWAER